MEKIIKNSSEVSILEHIFSLIGTTTIMYFVVTVAMRLMGKRQIGELSTSEVAVTLIISEVASMPISNEEISVWHGIIAITILVCLEVLISFLDLKFSIITQLTQGKPTLIIRDGKIIEDELKKSRLTLSELNKELRLKNISIREVFCAIIETNGQISIIPTNSSAGVTRGDLNVTTKNDPVDFAIIIDGEIKEKNLNLIGKNSDFVEKELKKRKISLKEVFAMYADTKGVTYFQKKEKR